MCEKNSVNVLRLTLPVHEKVNVDNNFVVDENNYKYYQQNYCFVTNK